MSVDRPNLASRINSVLLVGAIGLVGWNLRTTFNETITAATARERIAHDIEEINQKLTAALGVRWTAAHQRVWADQLAKENPTLKVPDPLEIKKALDAPP